MPSGPCGFNAWILQAKAEAFPSALKFFNAVKAKGVAVVFLSSRRDNQRQATLWNLDQAGYQGWEKLITRPDRDDFKSARTFKSKARDEFFAGSRFTLIANIGDQQSDIDQEPGIAGGNGWFAGTARLLMIWTTRSLLIAMLTAWRTSTLSNGFTLTFMVT